MGNLTFEDFEVHNVNIFVFFCVCWGLDIFPSTKVNYPRIELKYPLNETLLCQIELDELFNVFGNLGVEVRSKKHWDSLFQCKQDGLAIFIGIS